MASLPVEDAPSIEELKVQLQRAEEQLAGHLADAVAVRAEIKTVKAELASRALYDKKSDKRVRQTKMVLRAIVDSYQEGKRDLTQNQVISRCAGRVTHVNVRTFLEELLRTREVFSVRGFNRSTFYFPMKLIHWEIMLGHLREDSWLLEETLLQNMKAVFTRDYPEVRNPLERVGETIAELVLSGLLLRWDQGPTHLCLSSDRSKKISK